jgi:hypothetical protein
MGAALKELEHRGVVPASEAERLTQITDALFDGGDALETARQVNQLLVDEEAGALARSIASIAEDSLQRGTQGLPRAGGPAAKAATEDVHGALGGALLGFEIGGPWGALFGGVIGAAVASAAEAFT